MAGFADFVDAYKKFHVYHDIFDLELADIYRVLGVSITENDKEIKAAFVKLSKACHPDRNQGREEEAKEQFTLVKAAYDCIKDAAARQQTTLDIEKDVKDKRTLSTNYSWEDSQQLFSQCIQEIDKRLWFITNAKQGLRHQFGTRNLVIEDGLRDIDTLSNILRNLRAEVESQYTQSQQPQNKPQLIRSPWSLSRGQLRNTEWINNFNQQIWPRLNAKLAHVLGELEGQHQTMGLVKKKINEVNAQARAPATSKTAAPSSRGSTSTSSPSPAGTSSGTRAGSSKPNVQEAETLETLVAFENKADDLNIHYSEARKLYAEWKDLLQQCQGNQAAEAELNQLKGPFELHFKELKNWGDRFNKRETNINGTFLSASIKNDGVMGQRSWFRRMLDFYKSQYLAQTSSLSGESNTPPLGDASPSNPSASAGTSTQVPSDGNTGTKSTSTGDLPAGGSQQGASSSSQSTASTSMSAESVKASLAKAAEKLTILGRQVDADLQTLAQKGENIQPLIDEVKALDLNTRPAEDDDAVRLAFYLSKIEALETISKEIQQRINPSVAPVPEVAPGTSSSNSSSPATSSAAAITPEQAAQEAERLALEQKQQALLSQTRNLNIEIQKAIEALADTSERLNTKLNVLSQVQQNNIRRAIHDGQKEQQRDFQSLQSLRQSVIVHTLYKLNTDKNLSSAELETLDHTLNSQHEEFVSLRDQLDSGIQKIESIIDYIGSGKSIEDFHRAERERVRQKQSEDLATLTQQAGALNQTIQSEIAKLQVMPSEVNPDIQESVRATLAPHIQALQTKIFIAIARLGIKLADLTKLLPSHDADETAFLKIASEIETCQQEMHSLSEQVLHINQAVALDVAKLYNDAELKQDINQLSEAINNDILRNNLLADNVEKMRVSLLDAVNTLPSAHQAQANQSLETHLSDIAEQLSDIQNIKVALEEYRVRLIGPEAPSTRAEYATCEANIQSLIDQMIWREKRAAQIKDEGFVVIHRVSQNLVEEEKAAERQRVQRNQEVAKSKATYQEKLSALEISIKHAGLTQEQQNTQREALNAIKGNVCPQGELEQMHTFYQGQLRALDNITQAINQQSSLQKFREAEVQKGRAVGEVKVTENTNGQVTYTAKVTNRTKILEKESVNSAAELIRDLPASSAGHASKTGGQKPVQTLSTTLGQNKKGQQQSFLAAGANNLPASALARLTMQAFFAEGNRVVNINVSEGNPDLRVKTMARMVLAAVQAGLLPNIHANDLMQVKAFYLKNDNARDKKAHWNEIQQGIVTICGRYSDNSQGHSEHVVSFAKQLKKDCEPVFQAQNPVPPGQRNRK